MSIWPSSQSSEHRRTSQGNEPPAIVGRIDYLRGIKENVIVGRLIPAGTGCPPIREVYLKKDEPPAQPSLEELLQRESEDEDACR